MVFDFGGGTLDIAVMNLQKQIGNEHLHPHKVIAKDRITLGGEDFNEALFTECICKEYSVDEVKHQLHIPKNYAKNDTLKNFGNIFYQDRSILILFGKLKNVNGNFPISIHLNFLILVKIYIFQ